MSKTLFKKELSLSRFFPMLDHLYILQVLEYDTLAFLKWNLKHPLERNLQRKHQLSLTQKAIFLLISTILWMIFAVVVLSMFLKFNFFEGMMLLLLIQPFSAFFVLLANLTYTPIDRGIKQEALEKAKRRIDQLYNLTVVGITGSYGKTSTKDILYTLLKKKFRVVKTPKSFNTPLGVTQTILEDLKDNTQIFIVEIGAYKRGEIAKIAKLVKPKMSIITAVAPQHLERFGSIENIALGKFELAEGVDKNGLVILSGESKYLVELSTKALARVVFYGSDREYSVSRVKTSYKGTDFTLNTPKGSVRIHIPLIGEHHAKNFLAAATAALNLGLTLTEIQNRAGLILPTPHRLEIKHDSGLTIIDNTYNTNPESAQASLRLLKDYPGKQKILITPGLVELGDKHSDENQLFARRLAKAADQVIVVGENAKKDLLKGLSDSNFPKDKIHIVASTQDGMKLMGSLVKPETVVLLENDLPDQYF